MKNPFLTFGIFLSLFGLTGCGESVLFVVILENGPAPFNRVEFADSEEGDYKKCDGGPERFDCGNKEETQTDRYYVKVSGPGGVIIEKIDENECGDFSELRIDVSVGGDNGVF